MYRTAGVSAVSLETSCSRQTFSSIVCGAGAIVVPSLYSGLRNVRSACPFLTRAGARLGKLNTVDHLEKCLGARLNDVGTHARAAVGALVVLHVHDRFTLSIFAFGHTVHFEFAQHHVDAR